MKSAGLVVACKVCGKSVKRKPSKHGLQVDHIKSWAEHPDLRFDMTNCRTLCMACHYQKTFNRALPRGKVWGHNLCLKGG